MSAVVGELQLDDVEVGLGEEREDDEDWYIV